MVGHGQEIKGIFFYTLGSSGRGIVHPALPQEKPAFYIFNIPTQRLKIYNFIEVDTPFADDHKRTYDVIRREGIEPITTREELTDFTVTQWHILHEYIDEETEIVTGGEVVFLADGSWYFNSIPVFGYSYGKYGEITLFENFAEPEVSSASLTVENDSDAQRAYFTASTKVGLKHLLYVSLDLKKWDAVTFDEYSNTLPTGELVGSGHLQTLANRRTTDEDMLFYYLESEPITFTD